MYQRLQDRLKGKFGKDQSLISVYINACYINAKL